jgi:hypothetical protein
MYVALKPGLAPGADIAGKVVAAIEHEIGKIARPVRAPSSEPARTSESMPADDHRE